MLRTQLRSNERFFVGFPKYKYEYCMPYTTYHMRLSRDEKYLSVPKKFFLFRLFPYNYGIEQNSKELEFMEEKINAQ